MLSYCLVSPLFTPKVRILKRGRAYVLGRDPKADFSLPSEIISRRHAEVQWSPQGGFAINDLQSKNGTRVNDVPLIGPQLLRDGDVIALGPFMIKYREYNGDISALLEESRGELEATTALSRDVIADARLGSAASAGFGGNFAGQELLEICRLLALGERDGVLTVDGPGLLGQIGFQGGDIRRAQAGDLRGEDAARALLSLPSGRFEFVAGPLGGEKTCRIKTEMLAVDVARRLDETRAPAGAPASDVGSTSSTSTKSLPAGILPIDLASPDTLTRRHEPPKE